MIATFENTVGILVKAYLEGTLEQGLCYSCAVGNICAAAVGTRVTGRWGWEKGRPEWNNVFATTGGRQGIWPGLYEGEAKLQIDATGYTWQQLARIEAAFELANRSHVVGDSRFTGLMAVVDVLADIHGIDLATTEVAKALFVKA